MGQKTHALGFRLGVSHKWRSRWFPENINDFPALIAEDEIIRKQVFNYYKNSSSISHVEIERNVNEVTLFIFTSKPGIIIGKSGQRLDGLKDIISDEIGKFQVRVEAVHVKTPELNASLVGKNIAEQIKARVPYRRVVKMAIEKTMQGAAKGIRVVISGRLNGVEIARTEKAHRGSVPLHTLREYIDYALTEAHTKYGVLGIKVWINTEPGQSLESIKQKSVRDN